MWSWKGERKMNYKITDEIIDAELKKQLGNNVPEATMKRLRPLIRKSLTIGLRKMAKLQKKREKEMRKK